MSAKKNKPDKTVIVAIIGAIATVFAYSIGAYFNYRGSTEPITRIIEATSTMEAIHTQAAYLVATSTAIAQQNLQTYTLSIALPGEHTPPDSTYGVQSVVNDRLATRIQIPAIGIDSPIVQGDSWEDLKAGVGQKLGTANPGENGFIILSAYNDVFGQIFRDLDQLETGDEIIISTLRAQYVYVVENTEIIDSPNLELTYSPDESLAVLTSTYPYMQNTEWIVVYAILKR